MAKPKDQVKTVHKELQSYYSDVRKYALETDGKMDEVTIKEMMSKIHTRQETFISTIDRIVNL